MNEVDVMRSALEIAGLVRKKEISPVEAVRWSLERIDAVNPKVNAFCEIRPDDAIAQAKALEKKIASGEDPGPLAGVPIGVKDLEDAAGFVTSYGCTAFKNNRVGRDSIQTQRLRRAGAVVVGKTNVPEFGFTGFTKNRLYGISRNPWNLERTPGGSSGGAAAAVASGMVPMATGSDAGGSIRIPACYCGCFGIKPTYGRIPHGPLKIHYMTHTWTLGPLTASVADAAIYLDCASGHDPSDPESLPAVSFSFLEASRRRHKGLRISFNPTLGYAVVQNDVMRLCLEAVKVLEDMGHRVEIAEDALPDPGEAWWELMGLELYGQLKDQLEEIRPELGRSLADLIDHARGLGAERLLAHQRTRSRLQAMLAEFFTRHDILLTPSMPTEAFGAKGPPPSEMEGRPIPLLGAVAFTYPFNLTGHPAATVRTGLCSSGLPAGIQIIAPIYREDLVLSLAASLEEALEIRDIWPDVL